MRRRLQLVNGLGDSAVWVSQDPPPLSGGQPISTLIPPGPAQRNPQVWGSGAVDPTGGGQLQMGGGGYVGLPLPGNGGSGVQLDSGGGGYVGLPLPTGGSTGVRGGSSIVGPVGGGTWVTGTSGNGNVTGMGPAVVAMDSNGNPIVGTGPVDLGAGGQLGRYAIDPISGNVTSGDGTPVSGVVGGPSFVGVGPGYVLKPPHTITSADILAGATVTTAADGSQVAVVPTTSASSASGIASMLSNPIVLLAIGAGVLWFMGQQKGAGK